MQNTVRGTEEGLLEWASQGLHFACTKHDPASFVTDEKHALPELYLDTLAPMLLSEASEAAQERRLRAIGTDVISAEAQDLIDQIGRRTRTYGRDVYVMHTSLDEECERDVHKEVEEEQEIMIEYGKMQPVAEMDWNYKCISEGRVLTADALPAEVHMWKQSFVPRLLLTCMHGTVVLRL